MNIYSDKLAHIQVVINFRYSGAQMCTREDTLAHYLGAPFIDDVMRHNRLITLLQQKVVELRSCSLIASIKIVVSLGSFLSFSLIESKAKHQKKSTKIWTYSDPSFLSLISSKPCFFYLALAYSRGLGPLR